MGRTKKLTLAALGVVVALVIGTTVWILVANDFGLHEERVTIEGPRGELNAVLATPADDEGPFGLVVFVHGDGAADASRDDAYKPLWSAYAKAGFATLSWDKPGVNGAPGDWLAQSMHDRAAEVDAAISWAYTRPDLDTTRIGIWGISQAGWVVPQVLASRNDISFATLVGPAINWLRQGEFNLRADLAARKASPAEVDAALKRHAREVALLKSGADYATYRKARTDPNPMSPQRWGFVERNFQSDVTDVLGRISTPLLLVLGGKDRNVDVDETEAVYRQKVRPDLLLVKRFDDATHSITRKDIEYRDDFRVWARALFAPSSIYAPGYLDALQIFAARNS